MKEIACGCVPWRHKENGGIEVLVILRNGGYWEFPKGKQEKGETNEETALRELQEETGLVGTLSVDEPITISYSFTRNDIEIDKKVHLYLYEVTKKSKVTIQKREVADYVWLPREDVMQRVTYPEMKEAARSACKRLMD